MEPKSTHPRLLLVETINTCLTNVIVCFVQRFKGIIYKSDVSGTPSSTLLQFANEKLLRLGG